MTPLTLADLARNAYRTLGLTAGASQSDIDSAARAMRLWDDPAQIPATANDAAYWGPVKRARPDIESAVSRLADPETRVEERLWWFIARPPRIDSPLSLSPQQSALALHDAVVQTLHRSLITEVTPATLPEWRSLLDRLRTLSSSDEYLAWLLNAESGGDFEKRASPDEVAAAQNHMPQRLAQSLALSVESAMNPEDAGLDNLWAWDKKNTTLGKADQFVDLLRSAPANAVNSAEAEDPARRILDSLEDTLTQRRDQLKDAVSNAWKSKQIDVLRPACHRVVDRFDVMIGSLANQLVRLAPQNSDRADRVRHKAAGLLVQSAEAYEACYDYISAERALLKAFPFAKGTPLESSVRARLDGYKQAVDNQRRGAPPHARASQLTYTSGYTTRSTGTSSGGKIKRSGLVGLGILVAAIIRISLIGGSNSTSDSNPSFNLPSNYNVQPLRDYNQILHNRYSTPSNPNPYHLDLSDHGSTSSDPTSHSNVDLRSYPSSPVIPLPDNPTHPGNTQFNPFSPPGPTPSHP